MYKDTMLRPLNPEKWVPPDMYWYQQYRWYEDKIHSRIPYKISNKYIWPLYKLTHLLFSPLCPDCRKHWKWRCINQTYHRKGFEQ